MGCTCGQSFARVMENIPIIGHLVAMVHTCQGRNDRAERAGVKATLGICFCLCNMPAEAGDEATRHESEKLRSYALTARPEWMKRYHGNTLRQLVVPGSHQSGTAKVAKKLKPVPMAEGWTRCQSLSLSAQLQGGIRFFDLRIMTHDKDIWLHHNVVICMKLREVLEIVRDFITDNPSEIVFLYLTPDGKPVDWDLVRNYFTEYLRNRMIPERMRDMVISDILDQGKNVVAFGVPDVDFTWRSLESRWPNKELPSQLKVDLEHTIQNLNDHPTSYYYWYKAECTPLTPAIVRIIGGVPGVVAKKRQDEKFDFIEDLAAAVNNVVHDVINDVTSLPFNALSVDYVQDEVVDRLIALNESAGLDTSVALSPNLTMATSNASLSRSRDLNDTRDSVFVETAPNVSFRTSDPEGSPGRRRTDSAGVLNQSTYSTGGSVTNYEVPPRKAPPVEFKETNM